MTCSEDDVDGFHGYENPVLRLAQQLANGDEVDEFAEGVVLRLPIGLQSAKSRLVGEPERAAEGVGKETVGEVVREESRVINEIGSNVVRTAEGLSAIFASRIDGSSIRVRAAVLTNRVVSFEGVAERIDLGVAVGAGLNATMFL